MASDLEAEADALALITAVDEQLEELAPPAEAHDAGGNQKTAKRAVGMLVARDEGYHQPTPKQRHALLVGFAHKKKVLYGASFDLVKLSRPVDLEDPRAIERNIDVITIFEVKSSNRNLGPSFSPYFFSLSTAELLVAQSLGEKYRFMFVDIVSGDTMELSLTEVFGKATKIYPTWSIKF
jgi:hypothetical protein